jgi:hypothetical protein
MLLLLQAPQVVIAPNSWARKLLVERKSVREPLGLAAWGGFGDLRKHLLPLGDEQVRVWRGFGITNLQGLILQKRAGKWTAVRLIGGIPGTRFKSRKTLYPDPKSGWPVFWSRAEALGLWSLPDDSTLPDKNRKFVMDGFSDLVELQRGGTYRAYVYDNPELQTWAEAKRMVEINRLLGEEFPVGVKG